jgi:hypothetical protein
MARKLYDDGRYSVTRAIVATPRRFYPLAYTMASLRRDPLWIGLSVAGLALACILIYGDLLYMAEIAALLVLASIGLVIGSHFSVLRIDAAGHPRAFIFDSHRRLQNLYAAIRDAREADTAIILDSENQNSS